LAPIHGEIECLDPALDGGLDAQLEAEGRGDLLALLLLLDRDDEQPLLVGEADLELGGPGAVHPLLEEAVQVAAGGVLEGPLEVARVHRLVAVALQVEAHAGPERVDAQVAAQRVQDAGSRKA
jgi:hypothetical protein